MNRGLFLALVVVGISFTSVTAFQDADAMTTNQFRGDCKQNQICIIPGDYLNYEAIRTTENKVSHKIFYSFDELTSPYSLYATTTFEYPNNTDVEYYTIDLRTGSTDSFLSDGSTIFFDRVVTTPINVNGYMLIDDENSNLHYEYETTYEYKNLTRTVIIASDKYVDTAFSSTYIVDKETGIVLEFQQNNVFGNLVHVQKLIDTNIISDKSQSEKRTIVESDPEQLGIASFVDQTKDPQYYIDRYNNEPKYKEWFDTNYPQYSSIYEAVGLKEIKSVEIDPEPISIKTKKVPDWAKNIFGWYANDQVSEDELLNAITYLIKEGILKVD